MNGKVNFVLVDYVFVTKDMIQVTMRIDQAYRAQFVLCNKAAQYFIFLDIDVARVENNAVFGFILDVIAILLKG